MKLEFFWIGFRKTRKYKISRNPFHLEPGSMRMNGQTDMRKLVLAFRNFAKAPQNGCGCPVQFMVGILNSINQVIK